MTSRDGFIVFGANQDWWQEDRITAMAREQIMRRGRERPLPPSPPQVDPAIEWHEVTLPRLIAEGAIIDRGPDFKAQGFSCRHVYA